MRRGYDYEEESKPVDIPYKRYPRTIHLPFGMEVAVTPTSNGDLVATLPPMVWGKTSELQIKTGVNLLVELFGMCEVLSDSLDGLISAPIKRLNWEVLPKGDLPWAQLKGKLAPVTANRGPAEREITGYRFEVLGRHQPSFCAVGRNGFRGYVVFGFPALGFYMLESIFLGNATYVLGDDWEKLSQLSKAELIDQQLHKIRIIHDTGWGRKIGELFAGRQAA